MQGLDLLADYDYIAIFDADFKPEPDFLVRLGHWLESYAATDRAVNVRGCMDAL